MAVIIKKFDSRDETIEYEYQMQLNSRRLTDDEYFAAFLKLDEIRRSNPNVQGSSDEANGRQTREQIQDLILIQCNGQSERLKSRLEKRILIGRDSPN